MAKAMMTKFEHEVKIYPGWDRRQSDGGIHGAEIVFILKSANGLVTASYFTDWMPLEVQDEYLMSGRRTNVIGVQPVPMDMSCHSPIPFPAPLPTDRKSEQCPYQPGVCYSRIIRGGVIKAARDIMLTEGTPGIWRLMAQYYRSEFVVLLNVKDSKVA